MSELGPSSLSPYLAGWFATLSSPTSGTMLAERIGTADRCLHLTANTMSSVPLRSRSNVHPAWLANPAPGYYSGIGDALYAASWSMYARGDAFLWATSRYGTARRSPPTRMTTSPQRPAR